MVRREDRNTHCPNHMCSITTVKPDYFGEERVGESSG